MWRVASPELVTEAHVREYRERGFLAVDGVFNAAEIEAAKQGLTHLIRGGNPPQGEAQKVPRCSQGMADEVSHQPRLEVHSGKG